MRQRRMWSEGGNHSSRGPFLTVLAHLKTSTFAEHGLVHDSLQPQLCYGPADSKPLAARDAYPAVKFMKRHDVNERTKLEHPLLVSRCGKSLGGKFQKKKRNSLRLVESVYPVSSFVTASFVEAPLQRL